MSHDAVESCCLKNGHLTPSTTLAVIRIHPTTRFTGTLTCDFVVSLVVVSPSKCSEYPED